MIEDHAAEAPLVQLPPLAGPLDALWELILDIAEQVPARSWVLVGGQMVMLHGQLAGRVTTRASQDVDVLADLLTDEAGLARCVQAVRQLDLQPQTDNAGKVYRFVRAADDVKADILAPDHTPPRRRLRTVGGDTIRIDGGTQALDRFGGSDRQRLSRLDKVLGDRDATEWRQLGYAADDGYTAWRLLLG